MCTLSFDLVAATAGSCTNTIPPNSIGTSNGDTNLATATLNVRSLTLTRASTPTTVVPNAFSRVTLTFNAAQQSDSARPMKRIKDLLPGRAGHVGATARDNRLFVDAVLYRYRATPWTSRWGLHLTSGQAHDLDGAVVWTNDDDPT